MSAAFANDAFFLRQFSDQLTSRSTRLASIVRVTLFTARIAGLFVWLATSGYLITSVSPDLARYCPDSSYEVYLQFVLLVLGAHGWWFGRSRKLCTVLMVVFVGTLVGYIWM